MKILLATDGSASAGLALELVRSVDWPDGSDIRVISAIEPVDTALSGAWVPSLVQDFEKQAQELLASARATTQQAATLLARPGLTVQHEVFEGRPGSCIVEDATLFGADLIVLGSRGHGLIGSMVLGSVSAEVADHAPCPVLVARGSGLNKIILGADGSEYARGAEDWLQRWPIFGRAAIEVTSVAPVGLSWARDLAMAGYAPSAAEFAESDQLQVAEHQQFAQASAQRLQAAGLHAQAHVAEGDPAHELIRIAAAQSADAIVIGTHGRTGLARLVMGSVARNVLLHAPCSVLIVRDAQRKAAA